MKIYSLKSMNWETSIKFAMRIPHESSYLSDSVFSELGNPNLGKEDLKLAMNLVKSGPDHRKFIRQIFVSCIIDAPWYWWKEFMTYKIGTVVVSSSQMHTLGSRKLTRDDFDIDFWHVIDINYLDRINDRIYYYKLETNYEVKQSMWRAIIQMIPASFLYTRVISLNYEVLVNMYFARKFHKLVEWQQFLNYMTDNLPYPELFTRGEKIHAGRPTKK